MIRLIQVLLFVAYIFTVAYGWAIRFDEGGRVCSGAYMKEDEKEPEKVYLLKSGKFIKFYVFIATGLLCVPIVLLVIALLVIRAINKRGNKKETKDLGISVKSGLSSEDGHL